VAGSHRRRAIAAARIAAASLAGSDREPQRGGAPDRHAPTPSRDTPKRSRIGEAASPTKEKAAAEFDGGKAARAGCPGLQRAGRGVRGNRLACGAMTAAATGRPRGRPSVQDVGPECLQCGESKPLGDEGGRRCPKVPYRHARWNSSTQIRMRNHDLRAAQNSRVGEVCRRERPQTTHRRDVPVP
jgi:hypothetical protein